MQRNDEEFIGESEIYLLDQNEDVNRRQLAMSLGRGVITGVLGASILSHSRVSARTVDGSPEPGSLQDPRNLYPRPPFPLEIQSWPGLVSKMHPRPDHGEESYRGSGKMIGRRVLVTGGDSGIGRAAAIAFAREGADVAFNYLPQEESDAEEVVAIIRKEGRRAVPIVGDLRSEAFCKELIQGAVRYLEALDTLVLNAARQRHCPSILDLSSEEFDWTMKTNVYAPFWLTKAAVPFLAPGSSIIVTASEQAFAPSPNLLDYAQTKAANVSFVKALAKQLGPQGIRVNGVAPGPFWTPLQVSGGSPDEWVSSYGQGTLWDRPGQPEELAGIFVLLASSEGSYLTGQIMGATGGSGHP